LEQAFGRPVDIAINHDPEALAMHAANHPFTKHLCESVWDVDPIKVTNNQPVGLVWLSPDCKHFSKAKGGKPVEKNIRGLAWVAIRWLVRTKPRVFVIENVEEFRTWGPLLAALDGMSWPDPARKGETFLVFKQIVGTGIPVDQRNSDIIDEIREVLCTGPLAFSECEFEEAMNGLKYDFECQELRANDYDTPTIRKRFFMIGRRDGIMIRWPVATNGAPDSIGVRAGKLKPYRTAAECIDWSIPCPSIFERKRPLAPATLRRIAKGIMRYVVDAADPFIIGQGGPIYSGKPVSVNQPFGTLTTENHRAVVSPMIVPVTHQGGDRIESIGEPFRTVTGANRGEKALATAFLAKHYTGVVGSDLEDPLGTVTACDHHSLVTAFLTEHANATGQRVMPADEPLRTICAQVKGGHFSMVSAHVTKFRSGAVGSALDEPLHTVTAGGKQARPGTGNAMGIVTSNLVKLRGTSTAAGTDEPLGTVSAGGMHHAEVRAFLLSYYGTDQDPKIDGPLATITSRDRFGLVTIHGQDYQIVDIGLRMLAPRELYRAQGFPDSYIIGDDPAQGLTLTKSAQVRMCGNSVCPPLARALIEANFAHEREIARVA
jgi:DNA (cytosine-5)-methyltransferase 1